MRTPLADCARRWSNPRRSLQTRLLPALPGGAPKRRLPSARSARSTFPTPAYLEPHRAHRITPPVRGSTTTRAPYRGLPPTVGSQSAPRRGRYDGLWNTGGPPPAVASPRYRALSALRSSFQPPPWIHRVFVRPGERPEGPSPRRGPSPPTSHATSSRTDAYLTQINTTPRRAALAILGE